MANFMLRIKQLSLQCMKAPFALKKTYCNLSLNLTTLLSLFDTYVGNIANYGCEVWGSYFVRDVEKIHLNYCKLNSTECYKVHF